MNKLISAVMLLLATATVIPAASANEAICSGDAAQPNPPVVNNPTHIRNVIWRNTHAMCLQQMAAAKGNQVTAIKTGSSSVTKSDKTATIITEISSPQPLPTSSPR